MSARVELRVLQLLCSRLCHDLVGPVGAINNGVELMGEFEGEIDREALDLIADSARRAGDRLQLFRVAYGFAAGAVKTASDARGLVGPIFEGQRISLDWPQSEDVDGVELSDGCIKLLLNAVMLAQEALGRGGAIRVQLTPGPSAVAVEVHASGEAAGLEEETLRGLDGAVSADDLTPRTVHGYYTARVAESLGAEFTVGEDPEGGVRIIMNLPISA